MSYVFTLGSVFNSVLPKTQNRLDKPVCFTHANILLSYVNETIIFPWKPAFLQDSFQSFYGPGKHLEPMLSQNVCCAWGATSDFAIQENKICHCNRFYPIYLPWSDGTECHDLSFLNFLSFKPAFSFSSFNFIKRLFSSSLLSAIMWYHLDIWGCWYFQQPWFQLVIHPAQHFTWCTLHII